MSMFDPIPEGKVCSNCKERPATQLWVGDSGMLGATHGMYEYWCKLCVLTAQLDYARKAAERIPQLEKEINELS